MASGATVLNRTVTFADNSAFAGSSVVNITANNGALVTLNSATNSYGEKSFDITFPANPGPGPLIVTLTYTVIDAAGNTPLVPVTQTVMVDVANTLPVASDVTRDAATASSITYDLAPDITDIETPDAGLTIVVDSGPSHASL